MVKNCILPLKSSIQNNALEKTFYKASKSKLSFLGARRGLFNRAKETLVTLLLVSVVVCGSMYILAAVIDRDQHTMDTLFNLYSYYLPFLYSCVSFLGMLEVKASW